MATSRDKLQDIKNHLVTAHVTWSGFAEACVPAYDQALALHKKALKDAKTATELQAAQLSRVLNFALQAFIGPWVPRLLVPVEAAAKTVSVTIQRKVWVIDDLSAAWNSQALSGIKAPAKDLQDFLKDKAVSKAKDLVTGKTTDPFETSALETLIYTSGLKENINNRAGLLMATVDEMIESSDSISVASATELFNSYVNYCTFLTDVPRDTGPTFKKRFQDESELAMWISWAVVRDENYWRWGQNSSGAFGHNYRAQSERSALQPILDRLITLKVPAGEVSSKENPYAGGWTWEGIDMIKLIAWAKKMSKPKDVRVSPSKEVCRQIDPNWLTIRQNQHPNACYATGSAN